MRPAEPRAGAAPTRLACLPIVGEIGIYFRPERGWRKLTEAYADPADGDARAPQAHRGVAALSWQSRSHLAARPHPGAARYRITASTVATLILGVRDRWVPVTDAYRFKDDIKTTTLSGVFDKLGHDPMEEDLGGYRRCRCRLPKPIPPFSNCAPVHCKSRASATGDVRIWSPDAPILKGTDFPEIYPAPATVGSDSLSGISRAGRPIANNNKIRTGSGIADNAPQPERLPG